MSKFLDVPCFRLLLLCTTSFWKPVVSQSKLFQSQPAGRYGYNPETPMVQTVSNTVGECSLRCVATSGCTAFNFKINSAEGHVGSCFLHDNTTDSFPLVPSSEYIYFVSQQATLSHSGSTIHGTSQGTTLETTFETTVPTTTLAETMTQGCSQYVTVDAAWGVGMAVYIVSGSTLYRYSSASQLGIGATGSEPVTNKLLFYSGGQIDGTAVASNKLYVASGSTVHCFSIMFGSYFPCTSKTLSDSTFKITAPSVDALHFYQTSMFSGKYYGFYNDQVYSDNTNYPYNSAPPNDIWNGLPPGMTAILRRQGEDPYAFVGDNFYRLSFSTHALSYLGRVCAATIAI